MSDPSLELQAAIVGVLKNNVDVQAVVGQRIYDEVPPNPTFPYISLGDNQVLPDNPRADCIDGVEIFWQIDGWSRDPTFPMVKKLSKAVVGALDDYELVIDNYDVIVCQLNTVNYLHDPDGITRHVAISFRFLIQRGDPNYLPITPPVTDPAGIFFGDARFSAKVNQIHASLAPKFAGAGALNATGNNALQAKAPFAGAGNLAGQGVVVTAGKLYSWGYNRHGELAIGVAGEFGSGNYTRSVPVQVGALATWSDMACGWNNCFAVQSDGSTWAWGEGDGGELNNGQYVHQSSPVQIGTPGIWRSLATGSNAASCGIKAASGRAYMWGDIGGNPFMIEGAPGHYVAVPQQVGGNTTGGRTDWVQINTSAHWANGFVTSGRLYSWGENDWGQGGLGYYTPPFQGPSSPTLIAGGKVDWRRIINGKNLTAAALDVNKLLWMWGQNGTSGICGIGTTQARVTIPTQVLGGHTWTEVALGVYHVLAIDTSGYLWVWGNNNHGCLGLGLDDTALHAISSPVQLGSNKWVSVGCGWNWSVGVRTDGTLWSWGSNQYCKLGQGISNYGAAVSSPVQIGTGTTWRRCFAMVYTGFAIRT